MLKKLLEEINKLSEGDMDEINLQDEMDSAEPVEEKPFNDTMSLADTLDAKAKVARSLETLKAAIEDFKDATAEKLDLLQDSALLQGLEGLDQQIIEIEKALASGSKILGDSELNDPFKAELPGEELEAPKGEGEEDSQDSEETEEEEEEDYNFDDEAGLDLFASEE